jgi:hypothetical protein
MLAVLNTIIQITSYKNCFSNLSEYQKLKYTYQTNSTSYKRTIYFNGLRFQAVLTNENNSLVIKPLLRYYSFNKTFVIPLSKLVADGPFKEKRKKLVKISIPNKLTFNIEESHFIGLQLGTYFAQ